MGRKGGKECIERVEKRVQQWEVEDEKRNREARKNLYNSERKEKRGEQKIQKTCTDKGRKKKKGRNLEERETSEEKTEEGEEWKDRKTCTNVGREEEKLWGSRKNVLE